MEGFLNKLRMIAPNRRDLISQGYDNDLIDYFMSGFDPMNQRELPGNIKNIETLIIFCDIDNWTIGNLSLGGEHDAVPNFIVLASFDGGFILKDKNNKSFHFKYFDDDFIDLMCEDEKIFLEILLLLAKDYSLRIVTGKINVEEKEKVITRCNQIAPNFPFDILI